MGTTPLPRYVFSGAIRAAFDSVAQALELDCQVERESWVQYGGPTGSLAVHYEHAKGEISVKVGRGPDVFELPELLSASGQGEAARQARLHVANPTLLYNQLARLARFAHEQGACLMAKDDAFYRKALKQRRTPTPPPRQTAGAVIPPRRTPPSEICVKCGAAIPRGGGRYRRSEGSLCIGCGSSRPRT